jgi:hypothetical protein
VLAEFQQALVDLTASPELCNLVRCGPDTEVLPARYDLTARELRRLLAMVRHPGMAAACTVYRMNRLAPMALNIRGTIRALGPALGPLLDDYWRDYPRGHAHFYIETDRFCHWLRQRIAAGEPTAPGVPAVLEREAAAVRAALEASCSDRLSHSEITAPTDSSRAGPTQNAI